MNDKNDDTCVQDENAGKTKTAAKSAAKRKKASGEKNKAAENATLEERFETIETILERMESGEVSLDESFALYKKGLSEIHAANRSLDLIEKEMLVLNENGELEEFE